MAHNKTVFLVQHTHTVDKCDEVKVIGIYDNLEEAELAVRRLTQMPGFKKSPNGFTVDEYHLNQDLWTEGFEARS